MPSCGWQSQVRFRVREAVRLPLSLPARRPPWARVPRPPLPPALRHQRGGEAPPLPHPPCPIPCPASARPCPAAALPAAAVAAPAPAPGGRISVCSVSSAACNDGGTTCAACVSADLKRPPSNPVPFSRPSAKLQAKAESLPSRGPATVRVVPEPPPSSRGHGKAVPRALQSRAARPASSQCHVLSPAEEDHGSTRANNPSNRRNKSKPGSPNRETQAANSGPQLAPGPRVTVEPSMSLTSLIRAKKRAREEGSGQPELDSSSPPTESEPVMLESDVRSTSFSLFGELAAMLTTGSATTSKPVEVENSSDFVLPARDELLAQLEDLKSAWVSLGGPS